MKILKSITNIPVPITIALVASLVSIFVLTLSGQADIASILLLVILGAGLGLQAHYGSIIIKRVASVFIVFYITSVYTYLVSSVIGLVTQPFLLTLAGVTLFLSTTYDKDYKYELRSRKLWGTLLAIILVIFKLSAILTGYSYLIAEFAGFNLVVIYTLLWRLWVRNSKKTKIITPNIVREESDEKYKYIYISNRLDAVKNLWLGSDFIKNRNAYPYIYSESLKAKDDNLTLVIISERNNNEIYDLGEIELNKAKLINYLYMEAQDTEQVQAILGNYESEQA